jgi:GTPase SAR1 family protein
MLPPEVEEGNKEYKRYLINLSDIRFQQLLTQMKWRINEGNGKAYYYIGVEDDGSIFKLNNKQAGESLKNLKKLVLAVDGKIKSVDRIKDDELFYFKVEINSKSLNKYFEEVRILLLGDSGVGKTTFLAYLINNKLDLNSRMFIFNHKHEMESGKTSSFNHQYIFYENKKYVFLDTPGDGIYWKTLNRTLLSVEPNLIIYFKKNKEWKHKDLYYNYAKYKNIKWVEINLYSTNNNLPNINMKKPPRVKNILKFIDNSLKFQSKKTMNLKETEFIILETFPHIDLGWILTGFLSKGRLNVGKKLLWYCKESKEVTVKSIHKNNNPVNKISTQQIVTICLDKLINLKSKPKYGFLSNKKILSNKILVIEWIYLKNNDYDKINGFIDNNFINLRKIGKKKNSIIYFIENTFSNFYIKNKVFLFSDGFGIIN